MKKRNKIILLIITSIVLLGTIFGTIFAIYISNEGKWNNYYGLGYVVINMENCQDNPIKFGSYFATYACFIDAEYITSIEVVKTEQCDNKAKLYYAEENRSIYNYCLDQITVNTNIKTTQLKDYLEIDSTAIDFIINNFTEEPEGSYDDGGSFLYFGNDFNILKCHTLAKNNDIYIGNKNMEYFNDFCK
jgi:hypothetical protein